MAEQITNQRTSKSLLEQLPEIVRNGKKQAERIMEGLESRSRIGLQTRELVTPAKDTNWQEFQSLRVGDDVRSLKSNPENKSETPHVVSYKDWFNRLIYGDNLLAMAALLAGDPAGAGPSLRGKIDLIYIDPPFDSKADYRTKITLPGAARGSSQEVEQKPTVLEQFAYSDTWTDGTASYLAMIVPRLCLMRELLSDKGSIYVHLDWHVGHYVKIVMDEILGKENLRNEIVWKRTSARSDSETFNHIHSQTIALRFVTNGEGFPKETRDASESEVKSFGVFSAFLRGGYPTASTESGQIGLLRRAQEAPAATGCPIDFQQAAQFEFLPQGRAQQRKEPRETVAPLAEPSTETQQHIGQQRRPHLPAHGVGRVAQEVRQLEGLLELFEEHFNLPAAPVEVGDGLRAPRQVVGQENHLADFTVHLDPGHDAPQFDRIVLAGRAGEADQIVAENVPVEAGLKFPPDPALQIILGTGDPKDLARGQVGQMGEVQIGLVKDHNLPGQHVRAQFARPAVVVFAGGVHQGEAGQEGLQVEADMALGGGFAAAMFGPVQTAGDELNGGRVHDMDEPLEAEGELRAALGPEARMELLQMLEHGPEQLFGHLGIAFVVGVGEGVFAGRGRPTNRRQRSRVQAQRVTHIIEPQSVRELGVEQADHMTPRKKRARPQVHAGVPGQLRHEVGGNQIAELAQERKAVARWLADRLFFHPRPCGRVQTRRPTLFLPHEIRKPVGHLCFFSMGLTVLSFVQSGE